MQDTKSSRDFLVTILPGQAVLEGDRRLTENSASGRKYVRFEDTFFHCTKSPAVAGPSHFHEDTLRWACGRADLVLIEAGWLGPDSEPDFELALKQSRFVVCVRTFPQRADLWARALRPVLSIDAPLFAAIMPARVTLDPAGVKDFEQAFHMAYVGARQ